MKIPKKWELQQITFNHSSDIDFQGFMNLYKKCTAKPYSFLVIDTTLALDNPLRFRKNLLEIIQKIIMTIDDKIRDEKLEHDISREAAKISSLSQGKTYQYDHLTIKHWRQGRKQIDAVTKRNERLAALTNKHDHKNNYKEVLEKIVNGIFDEIKELPNETNHDNFIYYFTGNTAKNWFDDFNNGIELFRNEGKRSKKTTECI